MMGPAFVASVAYVDPGNFASNFQSGAEHGYLLVWAVVLANIMAMIVQYLASKLGLHSGSSLPEVCRERFPVGLNVVLWVQAELVAVTTDLAEIVGAAIGLNLVFGIALLPAGLITAVVAFGVLVLQRRGHRGLEMAIIGFLAVIAAGFVIVWLNVGGQSFSGIAHGLVPRLSGDHTVSLAVAIVGATVMPHVIYLHSALQATRIRPADDAECTVLSRYNCVDCCVGLGLGGLVNIAMICIAAVLFHHPGLTGISDLAPIHHYLGESVGRGAALAFGVALIASGLSSSTVGTYAGQVVMAGFMNWRIPVLVRRAMTIVPSLIVLAVAANVTTVLVYSQVVLAFGIPFALVPLALLTSRRDVMGHAVNRVPMTCLIWAAATLIVALNLVLIHQSVAQFI